MRWRSWTWIWIGSRFYCRTIQAMSISTWMRPSSRISVEGDTTGGRVSVRVLSQSNNTLSGSTLQNEKIIWCCFHEFYVDFSDAVSMDTVVQWWSVDVVETRSLPGPESEINGGQGPSTAAPLAWYVIFGYFSCTASRVKRLIFSLWCLCLGTVVCWGACLFVDSFQLVKFSQCIAGTLLRLLVWVD